MSNQKIKGAVATGVVLIGGLVGGMMFTEKIPAGHVGIIYNMNGGVQDKVLTQGIKFVSPFWKITKYSVATEQGYLTEEDTKNSVGDESFVIPTKDGKTVNVDLEFSYSFDVDKLPETYTRFRGRNGATIEDTFMKPKLKVWTGEVSSRYSVIDVYGEKRAELNRSILDYIKPKFAEYGIQVDSVNISRIGLDTQTEKAIQERVNAQQALERERIERDKASIEAEKKIIEAKGVSDSMIERAKGEAEAYKIKTKEITPELLKKWELDARLKHGWVTIQGGNPIVDARE